MANNIGFKIGIEGEKAFKTQIADINTRMKTLGSEMKVVSAQYDKNDNSMAAVTARTKTLNSQIDTQKEKIKVLEEALKNSADSFGENDKRTQAWQQKLNNATADLIKMENELENTNDKSGKFKTAMSNLGEVGKTALAGLATAAADVGAAFVSAGKQLAEFSVNAAAFADDILTTSSQTGIASDKLQEYQYAAELVDVSVETLTGSMKKNIKSMDNAAKGSSAYANAYAKLGVSVTNADGSLRDSEEVYWELINSLGSMENETERDALAMQLLGKSAQDLNPLIEAGAGRMQELGQKAHEAGYVMSDEMLAKFEEFDDNIQYLKVGADAAKNALGTVLMPVLNDLATTGTDLLGQFSNAVLNANGDFSQIGDAISNILTQAFSKITELLPTLISLVSDIIVSLASALTNEETLTLIINAIADGINKILEILPTLLPLILNATVNLVMAVAQSLLDNLPALINAVIEIVTSLASAIGDNLDILIPAVIDCVITIAEELLSEDNIGKIIDAAIQLIVGLASGLIQAIPRLILAIPKLIVALVKALTSKETWKKLGDAGIELVKGIGEGLTNGLTWIKDKIRSWVGNVVDFFKNLFGIHSPSTVMRDSIGKFLAKGIGVGFSDEMTEVKKQMENSLPTDFDISTKINSVSDFSGAYSSLGDVGQASKSYTFHMTFEINGNFDKSNINELADAVSEKMFRETRRKVGAFA